MLDHGSRGWEWNSNFSPPQLVDSWVPDPTLIMSKINGDYVVEKGRDISYSDTFGFIVKSRHFRKRINVSFAAGGVNSFNLSKEILNGVSRQEYDLIIDDLLLENSVRCFYEIEDPNVKLMPVNQLFNNQIKLDKIQTKFKRGPDRILYCVECEISIGTSVRTENRTYDYASFWRTFKPSVKGQTTFIKNKKINSKVMLDKSSNGIPDRLNKIDNLGYWERTNVTKITLNYGLGGNNSPDMTTVEFQFGSFTKVIKLPTPVNSTSNEIIEEINQIAVDNDLNITSHGNITFAGLNTDTLYYIVANNKLKLEQVGDYYWDLDIYWDLERLEFKARREDIATKKEQKWVLDIITNPKEKLSWVENIISQFSSPDMYWGDDDLLSFEKEKFVKPLAKFLRGIGYTKQIFFSLKLPMNWGFEHLCTYSIQNGNYKSHWNDAPQTFEITHCEIDYGWLIPYNKDNHILPPIPLDSTRGWTRYYDTNIEIIVNRRSGNWNSPPWVPELGGIATKQIASPMKHQDRWFVKIMNNPGYDEEHFTLLLLSKNQGSVMAKINHVLQF